MNEYQVTINWIDYLFLTHLDVIIGILIGLALLYFGLKFLTGRR